jgi:hypothetical protein
VGPGRTVAALSLACAVALASCSSGSAATSTTLDRSRAITSITDTVKEVFDGATGTPATKIVLVQQGSTIAGALAAYFSSPATRASTARVSQVAILDPSQCASEELSWPCARVTNDILLSGKPSLSGEKTYVVEVNGRWKVAKVTMCGLIALRESGQTPPGC